MPVISLALGIAEALGLDKKIARLLKSPTGKAASKVIDIAHSVVGDDVTPDALLQKIKTDHATAAEIRQQILANQQQIKQLAYQDRHDARRMYRETGHDQADKIAHAIINYNLWLILALVVINGLAIYGLREHAAVLATVSNLLGIVIKSLLDERKEVTGFYFGGSLENRQLPKP